MTHTFTSVCFDLDDTLYAYHEYARAGLEAAADHLDARTGLRLHDELRQLYFDDDIVDGTFDEILDRHGVDTIHIEELIDAFHGATGPLEPYPETEAVLSRLEPDYRLGLITDGRGGHAKLRRLGLDGYFDAVSVTPTIGLSKHEQTVFDRTLSRMAVLPEESVYVGDDPRVDFRVPNALGMTTVRLRRGRFVELEPTDETFAPDHEISRLDELGGLLSHVDVTDRQWSSPDPADGTARERPPPGHDAPVGDPGPESLTLHDGPGGTHVR